MTSIDAPRDDEGVLRLRFHRDASGLNPGPHLVQPYAVVRQSMDRDLPPVTGRRRRGADRRQDERRQRTVPVLLDTRGHRERRSRLRRSADRTNGRIQRSGALHPEHAPALRLGVDCYV